jgi:hypothetical protein
MGDTHAHQPQHFKSDSDREVRMADVDTLKTELPERGDTLFAEDIAHRLRVDVSTARRWLADLEREYGSTIVGRRGRTFYTTYAAIARVRPAWCPLRDDGASLRAVREHAGRTWRRVTALAHEVHELSGRVSSLSGRIAEIVIRMERLERA